jgi:putative tryptophan/tyrosine transport system substrate-binding protein
MSTYGVTMRRREFIGLLGGAAGSWAFPASAQQRPRIGILHSGFPKRTAIHLLLEALSKLGYGDADIDLLGAEGDPGRLKALVDQLREQRPSVIIAITPPAAIALKEAKLRIPVVFATVADPVGLGIVESFSHPGGDFTGVAYAEAEIGGKQLELLVDAIAGMTRAAVLWSASTNNAARLENIRKSASTHGIEIFSRQLRGAEDLASAFDEATRAEARAAVFMTDNALFGQRKRVAELALTHGLPTIHSFRLEVQDGGLMSYGPSDDEILRRAAALADRILRGARPSELPVENPTKFELVINLKTAKALSLTIPPALLALANEVIE